MVVCRCGKESGDAIHQTWLQLEKAFGVKKDNDRLKNNIASAGIPAVAKLFFRRPLYERYRAKYKHQKPPDMLMTIILFGIGMQPSTLSTMFMSMSGGVWCLSPFSIPAVAKLFLRWLLYEKYRAKSINSIRSRTSKL